MSDLTVNDLVSDDRLMLGLTRKDVDGLLLVLDLARDALIRGVEPAEIETILPISRIEAARIVDGFYDRIKCEIADQKLGKEGTQ
jgi:hypothetical protein